MTLLEAVLDQYGVHVSERHGWQTVRCPNSNYHAHNDRTKSASVHFEKGLIKCHVCGLHGGAASLIETLEGVSHGEAIRRAEALVHDGGGVLPQDGLEGEFLPRRARAVGSGDHRFLPSRSRRGPSPWG